MSNYDYNINNSFNNHQNIPNEPVIEGNKYDINTMTIPKRHKTQVTYEIGMDNYVFNEIKKAKYQGAFDPGSLGNKNIFVDSNKINKNYSGYGNQQKLRKSITQYNRYGEGKNLLIIKSETKYPLNFGNNSISSDVNYNHKQDKNIYNFNNYYIETRNNNYRNIYARSNDNKKYYFSPSNNGKKSEYSSKKNNYLTKTINIEKLNNDYNKRFKNPQKILYEKYSTNTISFNTSIKNYSPIFAPSREDVIKQNSRNLINLSHSKTINDINTIKNENMNNTYNFDNDNNIDNYMFNDTSIDNYEIDNNMKKINFYRKKIINLFLIHINNFYKLHFKSLFNEIIDIIKNNINNKEHNFENKTIKNIAVLKKEIKTNSFYYGHKGKYNNLLKEVRIKKNIPKNKQYNDINKNDETNIDNPKYLKTDINITENYEKEIYDKKNANPNIIYGNKRIKKKVFIGDKGNTNNISNKNNLIKNIPQGIYGKKIVSQRFNKLKTFNTNEKKDNNYISNILDNENIKKYEKTPIVKKKLAFPQSTIIEKKAINSGIKIINNNFINNNNNNNENITSNEFEELENLINKKSRDNNNDIMDNFEIDKNTIYTIKGYKEIKNINNEFDDNECEFENYSNKNLENAINIITKVIENKEKDDKENIISQLIRIVNKIIITNKIKYFELIKEYYNILRRNKKETQKGEKKNLKKLQLSKDLIKNVNLKRNKKLKKYLFLSDLEDNKEKLDIKIEKNGYKSEDDCKNQKNRKSDKFRIIIKKIKLLGNKNANIQYDNYKPKTPKRYNKNNIIKINNKTPEIIIKKTINIFFNKSNKTKFINDKESKKELNEENNYISKNEKGDYNEKNNEKEDYDILANRVVIVGNNLNNEENDEKFRNKLNEDFSFQNFTKLRKNKNILKQFKDGDVNNGEKQSETEKFDDYENFILFFRIQLIYCFLSNKNINDSLLD